LVGDGYGDIRRQAGGEREGFECGGGCVTRSILSDSLSLLDRRERRIFEARRLTDEPLTREELSDEFGISPERVRQIEMRAFEKVQRAVKVRVEESDQPGTPRQFVAGVAQEPTFHLE
jgi:hypothetical protein